MKKYKITTAKKAVQKGYLKEGDKFTVEFTVDNIKYGHISCCVDNRWYGFEGNIKIRIPIPEPKAIDFGEAGRVLKYTGNYYDLIYITTGKTGDGIFYAYRPDDGWAGALQIGTKERWTDITDTYKP